MTKTLSKAEIEEIIDVKEFYISLSTNRLFDGGSLHIDEIFDLCTQFEECADSMHEMPAYHSLSQNIYEMVVFIRANAELIVGRQDLFLRFLKQFTPTLKRLRHVLFDDDIENKQGFYASFASDCKMVEMFMLSKFDEEHSDCTIF